jgi:hypothetical protein
MRAKSVKDSIKKIFLILAAVTLGSGFTFAAGSTPLDFATLDINMGTRAAGMAGAFTAMSGDASAVFYNPAGLSDIKLIQLDVAYDKWLLDSSFQYANAALPVGYGVVGGFFSYTNYGVFEQRDSNGVDLGSSINPNSISGGLDYGAPVTDYLSLGMGLKISNMSIASYSALGFLLDAGALAKIGDIGSIGAALQNFDLNSSGVYDIRGGLSVNVLNISGNKLTAALDAKYSTLYSMSYAAGIELKLFKILTLRGGYDFSSANQALEGITGLSAGAGIKIDQLSFDYAFTSKGDLGITNLVGLTFLYESSEEKEKEDYAKLTRFLAMQTYLDGEELFKAGDYKGATRKWEDVKAMAPDYEGIDIDIAKAKKMISSAGDMKRAEKLFAEGMKFYEKFEFDKAAKTWDGVKNIYPAYKDIDLWLNDARELKSSKGMSKQAEKYFRDGLKYYNDCEYTKALSTWQAGLAKDPNFAKIKQYIERTKIKQQEMQEDISKAKAEVAKDASVVEGVKKLRNLANMCPSYEDATSMLSTLKELINSKTKEYYYKGIEKYTDGNLDAAIVYWKNIEELDPKSDYVLKVKRYIEDARSKQKALRGMEGK